MSFMASLYRERKSAGLPIMDFGQMTRLLPIFEIPFACAARHAPAVVR